LVFIRVGRPGIMATWPVEKRMQPDGLAELAALRTQVQSARLADDVKHASLWCLDQLPKLYEDFFRTYESRFADVILGLARAVLKRLAEKGSGKDAGRVAEVLVAQLGGLHGRLGLAPLVLRPASGRGRVKKGGRDGSTAA
jgi:hypothetical protein